jgi:hypothetical protein
MKYLLCITLLIAACKQAPSKNVFIKDFGYGNEEFTLDSSNREIVENMFSYQDLSKTALELMEFPDTTVYKKTPKGVSIKGVHYPLTSLFPDGEEGPEGLFLSSAYFFKFGGKDYILFYVTYQPPNSRYSPHQGILVDLAAPHRLMPFPGLQYSTTALCINDFDHDGTLDYAYWDMVLDRISCYHLIGGHFLKDEKHYISLESSIGNFHSKNKENSYWYE